MRVFICKFSNEEDVEHKIGRLVSKERRQAGNNLRVFCVDEQIQKRLDLAGIRSEIIRDFHFYGGADEEANWEKAYELSDELHFSAENDDTLKYSGINFLSLEHNMDKYVLVIKFSNLCRQMVEQNCEILILVLPKIFSTEFPDINSSQIKTVIYSNSIKSLVIRVCPRALYRAYLLGHLLLRNSFISVKECFKKSVAKDYPASTRKRDQKQHKVLFVVTAPLYYKSALTICDECLRNGLIPHVATDDVALSLQLQRHHIEYSMIKSPSLIALLFTHGEKMLRWFYRLRRHVNSFFDNGDHHDTELAEFSMAYLCKESLLNALPQLCVSVISSINFLEGLINTTSPDIICLMPDGHLLPQMASALAKEKYNIPTLACGAAFDTGNSPSYIRHLHAEKTAVMGEKVKNFYIESGLKPERIVVTGTAHFDLLFNRNKQADRKVLLGCGIDPSKRIIVFATGTTDITPVSEAEEALIGTIAAVLKLKDTQLVIKVHPREEIGIYQTIAEKYHDSRIHVVKDIDLYALISNCELFIAAGASTSALEAMIIDKPVVIINPFGQSVPVPYATEGAAIGVDHYEDIEQAILKSLYDEETRNRLKAGRDEFVRNWSGEPDGKASQRIVMLVKEMIATNRESSSRLLL